MTLLDGQDLLEAAMERGLDEYAQGAIEDEVATLMGARRDEPLVQALTEMVIRGYMDGYTRAEDRAAAIDAVHNCEDNVGA